MSDMTRDELHIVFDGPPGPESGRFVECETADGRGIHAGEWRQVGDYWHLVILRHPAPGAEAMREAAELLAAAQAHRACCGSEHDPASGKLHGYCVVCGVPWPCDSAKRFLPVLPAPEVSE